MGWNRKSLMTTGRANGFKGKTAEEFVAFAEENGLVFEGLDTPEKITEAFNKTVHIKPTAGEDVVIDPPDDGEPEDPETLMEDGEEDAELKAFRRFRKFEKSGMLNNQKSARAPVVHISPETKAANDRIAHAKKAYDNAIKGGYGVRVKEHGIKRPSFNSADRCEAFGAIARLDAFAMKDYAMRDSDERIVERAIKDGTIASSGSYGSLVIAEVFPELIENMETYGAFEQAVGVTSMRNYTKSVFKLHSDVTVYKTEEGIAATESDAQTGRVPLVAEKYSAMSINSREVEHDAAISIGEMIFRSAKRAMDLYIDNSCILGQNNTTGILSILAAGSDNLLDTASGGWGNITVDDVQDVQAKAPGWVYDDPRCGWMCSWGFAQSVFYKFGLDAGGNTGRELQQGFRDRLMYNGFPIYISQAMNSAYDAGDNVPLLFGAWSHACKFGVVDGSDEMRTSEDRYFEKDQIAFRYDKRWAHSLHDVAASGVSGIVGLQD